MQTDELKLRTKKIVGQLSGVERMIDEDRTCIDVIQQIIAVRSALASLGAELIAEEAKKQTKVNKKDAAENLSKLAKSLFKVT